MKTIGIIGGMSWESSAVYYSLINRGIQAALGGLHSARLIMFSVDFAEIEPLQTQGKWKEAGDVLAHAASCLEASGAELVLIGTNTMHKVADQVSAAISVPLLHIAEAIGEEAKAKKMQRLGLMGTRFTMEQDFLKKELNQRYELDIVVPASQEREVIHRIIYDELCRGIISDESRRDLAEIAGHLGDEGAQGVILGCTELPLLLSNSESPVPVLDTTALHAQLAVSKSLE